MLAESIKMLALIARIHRADQAILSLNARPLAQGSLYKRKFYCSCSSKTGEKYIARSGIQLDNQPKPPYTAPV